MTQLVNAILTEIMPAFLIFPEFCYCYCKGICTIYQALISPNSQVGRVFFHTISLIPISRFALCLPFEGQISAFSINILELPYLLAIKQKLVSFFCIDSFPFSGGFDYQGIFKYLTHTFEMCIQHH